MMKMRVKIGLIMHTCDSIACVKSWTDLLQLVGTAFTSISGSLKQKFFDCSMIIQIRLIGFKNNS